MGQNSPRTSVLPRNGLSCAHNTAWFPRRRWEEMEMKLIQGRLVLLSSQCAACVIGQSAPRFTLFVYLFIYLKMVSSCSLLLYKGSTLAKLKRAEPG